MGSGKSFRREDKRAIPRGPGPQASRAAILSRQSETRHQPAPAWTWITGEDALVKACLDMLHGIPGMYPIFGIKLEIQVRQSKTEDYPVLVYYGAEASDRHEGLHETDMRDGFAMSPDSLKWNVTKTTRFKTEWHELLTRTLLGQPEMQMARQDFFAEQEKLAKQQDEQAREAQTKRTSLVARLRNQVATPMTEPADLPIAEKARPQRRQKPEYPEVDHISELIDGDICVFYHYSGTTLKTCEGDKRQLVVRISGLKDENHPMFRASQLNVFAFLDEVVEEPENPKLETEMQREGQAFRVWLREEGILNTPQQSTEGEPSGNVVGTATELSTS
ncbi:MAG: hypothetical protein KBC50_02735 [Candidatus Pacebacteria bacterium]|nr:hypothetical protein [Candidatus Paceibacterota bacterium]